MIDVTRFSQDSIQATQSSHIGSSRRQVIIEGPGGSGEPRGHPISGDIAHAAESTTFSQLSNLFTNMS